MKDTIIFDAELHSDSFYLRPWRGEDARWYVESRDEEVFRWTRESRDLTVEEAKSNIERYRYDPDNIGRAIVDSDGDESVNTPTLSALAAAIGYGRSGKPSTGGGCFIATAGENQ